MEYAGGFLWPPRPETAIHHALLNVYLARGWRAQTKKNGQCVLIVAHKGGAIEMWDRHREPLKWRPSAAIVDRLSAAISPKKRSAAVVAELLHAKVPGIRDTLFFHDMIAFDGQQLVGSTWESRQKLLEERFPGGAETLSHYDLGGSFWRVRNHDDADALFKALMAAGKPEDEGVVIKDPRAVLSPMVRQSSNSEWQAKSRKPHKNYAF